MLLEEPPIPAPHEERPSHFTDSILQLIRIINNNQLKDEREGMIYKLVQHEEFVVMVIKCINKIVHGII
jgi:hypothetical protein